MSIVRKLEALPSWCWTVLGLLFTAIIGVLDYYTAPEAVVFYLLPVLFAARFGGFKNGLFVSVAGAFTWLFVDVQQGATYSHFLLPYWNITGRLALFTLCAGLVTRVVAEQRQRTELTEFILHDIRSPLTNVISGLQTLRALASERNDELEMELIDAGIIGGNRVLTLANTLMDSGRLAGGKMPVVLSSHKPENLIEAAREQVALWANNASISIQTTNNAHGKSIVADRELTERILVNLLSNAIKYSPPESTVTVSIDPYEGNQVSLTVANEGTGMTEREAKAVFGKYTQAGKSGRNTGGAGIGLAFCRLAVVAQKGRIWLTGKPGSGVAVTFTLPAVDSPVEIMKMAPDT